MSWQGNWIHRGEKRPANPVTRFPVGETPRRVKGCTRQSADLASHRYPARQSAACVIFVSYSWTRLRREGSQGSEGSKDSEGRLTALRAEGCGRLSAAGCVPTGETTHYDLCVAGAPSNHVRCASLRSRGDSGFAAEGCGLPLRAMLIKSALRDLLSVSYDMISILVISRCAAPPYPAAPDFLHGKACHTILRSLCSLTARLSPTHNILRVTAFLQNMFAGVTRVPLPPHPGDRINRSMLSCRDMAPWLNTHSPTTKWGWQRNWIHRGGPRPANPVTCFPPGKVVAPATKGGRHHRSRKALISTQKILQRGTAGSMDWQG